MRSALFALLLAFAAAAPAQPADKPLMLVATPAMQGLYSRTALIVVPAGKHHLGFIVNRATSVRVGWVLPEHAASAEGLDPVHFGGPDMADTLFAVVRGNPGGEALPLLADVYLATSAETLARVVEQGGAEARFFAGFVAWEAGELQSQLASGNWYVADADAELFFRRDTSHLWEDLVERLGSAQAATAPGALSSSSAPAPASACASTSRSGRFARSG